MVSNPEFLKEGAAVGDFMKPDRIIVGTESARATEMLRSLYEPFSRNHDKLIVMDVRSAELTKYAANAMLATKISFMNELANLAESCGADIEHVRIGIGSDPRIGFEFIYPGCGYGGSCFPKDVNALIRSAHELDFDPELVRAVESVNDRQKQRAVRQDRAVLRRQPAGPDDRALGAGVQAQHRRHARSVEPRAHGAGPGPPAPGSAPTIPKAQDEARRIYGERPDLVYCKTAYEALDGADVLVIVTEWQEFRSPDFDLIRDKL